MGLIKQILVPSDFSETSERALEFAMKLAHDTDATLHLLNVDDDPVLNSPTTSEQFRDKYEDKLATILASLLDDDSRQELTPTYSIRRGDAAVEIVNSERKWNRPHRYGRKRAVSHRRYPVGKRCLQGPSFGNLSCRSHPFPQIVNRRDTGLPAQ